jgi:hypothetical protein
MMGGFGSSTALEYVPPITKSAWFHRQDGTRRRYQLDPAGITAVRAWLDGLWEQAFDAYRAAVEQDNAP